MKNSGIGGYKPLAMEFTKYGFRMSCLVREGDVAIYEQRGAAEAGVWYEVVVVRRMEAITFTLGGVQVRHEAQEVYPGSSQWGQMGWTYRTLPEAETRFKQIKQRRTEKENLPDAHNSQNRINVSAKIA